MKSQAQSNRESKWRGNGSASSISIFAEQAFWRAAGARLIPGNSARVLKDAAENYPAWLEAIESARHTTHFESYVIHEDEQGQIFAAASKPRRRPGAHRLRKRSGGGSSSRAAAGVIQIGRTVGAAITNRRALGPAEARIMVVAGLLLVAASAVAVMWPRVVSWPLAVISVWIAVSAFIRAFHLRREGKREEKSLKSIRNEIGQNEPCQ
jgi:hypothetical protein